MAYTSTTMLAKHNVVDQEQMQVDCCDSCCAELDDSLLHLLCLSHIHTHCCAILMIIKC